MLGEAELNLLGRTVRVVVTVLSQPLFAVNTFVYVPEEEYVLDPTEMLCPLHIVGEAELSLLGRIDRLVFLISIQASQIVLPIKVSL